jgi:hypothetical protein
MFIVVFTRALHWTLPRFSWIHRLCIVDAEKAHVLSRRESNPFIHSVTDWMDYTRRSKLWSTMISNIPLIRRVCEGTEKNLALRHMCLVGDLSRPREYETRGLTTTRKLSLVTLLIADGQCLFVRPGCGITKWLLAGQSREKSAFETLFNNSSLSQWLSRLHRYTKKICSLTCTEHVINLEILSRTLNDAFEVFGQALSQIWIGPLVDSFRYQQILRAPRKTSLCLLISRVSPITFCDYTIFSVLRACKWK